MQAPRTLSGPQMSPDRLKQFKAVLGDLRHKEDLYLHFGDFGPVPEAYFTNKSQAKYLRSFAKHLVPRPDPSGHPPSDHNLGSIFEVHYYSDLNFRLAYLSNLASFPGKCKA